MKRSLLTVLALGIAMSFAGVVSADDAEKAVGKDEVKTVSGKSTCATCEGVVTDSAHNILLTDEDGHMWILVADKKDNASYKEAHKVRKSDKQMTAKYTGEAKTKKTKDGKEYKEVKVTEVTVEKDKA